MVRGYKRRIGGRSGGRAARGRTYYPVAPIRKRRSTRAGGAPLRRGPRTQLRMRARTRTVPKSKRTFQSGVKTGENTSISATYYRGSRSKLNNALFRQIMGRRKLVLNASGRVGSTYGQQAIHTITHMPRAYLSTLKAEYQTIVPGNTSNDCKIYLGSKKFRTVIRNQSNLVCKVLIYDITTRNTAHGQNHDTPVEAWNKGLVDMSVVSNPELHPGATPFSSPEFRRNFSVTKVTSVPMEPGQEHEHTTHHKLNRVVNSTMWDNSVVTAVPGLTTFTMIVWYGSLVHESASTALVTPGTVNFDWATYEETDYGFIPFASPNLTMVNSFPLSITDPDFMGQTEDADTNIVNS